MREGILIRTIVGSVFLAWASIAEVRVVVPGGCFRLATPPRFEYMWTPIVMSINMWTPIVMSINRYHASGWNFTFPLRGVAHRATLEELAPRHAADPMERLKAG